MTAAMDDVTALTRAADRLNALADDPAGLTAAFTPRALRTLAAVLQQLAFVGGVDGDLLHRVGGPQTVQLARILGGENDGGDRETAIEKEN